MKKKKKKKWCEQQTNLLTPLPLISSLIISQRSSISFLHHSLKFRIYHLHVRETAFPKATSYCRFSKSNGYVFIFFWMNISLLQKQFLTWLLWPPPTGFPFVSLASPYFRSFFFAGSSSSIWPFKISQDSNLSFFSPFSFTMHTALSSVYMLMFPKTAPVFRSLGIDIWSFCYSGVGWGGCLMRCRIFRSIRGLYLPVARSLSPTVITIIFVNIFNWWGGAGGWGGMGSHS